MAAGQLNRTRRALLGAAVAVPVLSVIEGPVLSVVEGPALGAEPLSSSFPRRRESSLQTGTSAPDRLQAKVRDDARWTRALAAFQTAEAGLRAFERRTAGAPWEEQEAVEQGMDDRLDVLYAALRRLLRIPAPDLHALARKITLAVDHEVGTLTGGETSLAMLKRDAWRMARDRATGR